MFMRAKHRFFSLEGKGKNSNLAKKKKKSALIAKE